MTTELQRIEPRVPAPQSIFDLRPAEMIARAAEVATVLRDVIVKQHLAVNIQGREYVKVDGWAAMGSLLGLLPREVDVKEIADGSFEAKVELYSLMTGKVVGQGSALCGKDERRWSGADRYARRSMAITRATGKAYRLGLSWVMTLAGYAATPYEEMPVDGEVEVPFGEGGKTERVKPAPPKVQRKAASLYEGTEEQVAIVQRILETKGVSRERWPEVHDRLLGRPSTDINRVIMEVASGPA